MHQQRLIDQRQRQLQGLARSASAPSRMAQAAAVQTWPRHQRVAASAQILRPVTAERIAPRFAHQRLVRAQVDTLAKTITSPWPEMLSRSRRGLWLPTGVKPAISYGTSHHVTAFQTWRQTVLRRSATLASTSGGRAPGRIGHRCESRSHRPGPSTGPGSGRSGGRSNRGDGGGGGGGSGGSDGPGESGDQDGGSSRLERWRKAFCRGLRLDLQLILAVLLWLVPSPLDSAPDVHIELPPPVVIEVVPNPPPLLKLNPAAPWRQRAPAVEPASPESNRHRSTASSPQPRRCQPAARRTGAR
jgi:hypothetical protein